MSHVTNRSKAGVNFIFYFGTTFFQGIGIADPFRISIILAAGKSHPLTLHGSQLT
jgi:hypothetical protein